MQTRLNANEAWTTGLWEIIFGHFSKLIREVHKNAGIYYQNSISENKMYSFCVEEQKGLTYHLEGVRVPLVVRVPQFGNYRSMDSVTRFLNRKVLILDLK